MQAPNPKPDKTLIAVISTGFVIWSAAFIYRSSFIAIDGRRYFCLFDDAMISMRYAWNFSHGLGLVWNAGEYIQGYTNLLMTLLMSLATLVLDKSSAALAVQILGVALMLAIAFVSMKIAGTLASGADPRQRAFIRILSFFCALSYYPLLYWTLMGMETGVLTLLLLLGCLSALEYRRRSDPARLYSMSACLGLAYLTRNDSLIFSALVWAYLIWEIRAAGSPLRQLLAAAGLYFLFVVGQSSLQYLYYGEMLPNTYTLKLTGMPLSARLMNGLGFIRPFLIETAFLLILSGLDLILDFRRDKLLLFSIVLSAVLYQVYIGGDPWNYWRIMSPTIPLLTLLFIGAVVKGLSFSVTLLRYSNMPGRYLGEVLAVLVVLIGLGLVNRRFAPEISLSIRPYQALDNKANVNTAIALSQLTRDDASVGVFWAGAVPYFTGLKAVDFLGKSDRYIAGLPPDLSGRVGWNGMSSVPGHNKYDLNYSIRILQPTYVQIFQEPFQWGGQDLSEWGNAHYVTVRYRGVSLLLLKDSASVLWSRINGP